MAVIYSGNVEIRKVTTGPYNNNCYIVVCPQTREGVIIDTPAEPEKVLAEAEGIVVKAIIMTHCHRDHVLGHSEIKAATRAPVWVHESEATLLPDAPEHLLRDNEVIAFGSVRLQALHTPGHTPGGTCLLWDGHLFSGDTIFPDGPGKTSNPDRFRQLLQSLEQHVFVLPADTLIHPGHGADTTLSREKEQFRLFQSRAHRPDLCGDVVWLEA